MRLRLARLKREAQKIHQCVRMGLIGQSSSWGFPARLGPESGDKSRQPRSRPWHGKLLLPSDEFWFAAEDGKALPRPVNHHQDPRNPSSLDAHVNLMSASIIKL